MRTPNLHSPAGPTTKDRQAAYDKRTGRKNTAIAGAAGAAAGAAGGAVLSKLALGKKIASLKAQAAAEKNAEKKAAIEKKIARLRLVGGATTAAGAVGGGVAADYARRKLNLTAGAKHVASKFGKGGYLGPEVRSRALSSLNKAFTGK